jgi:hypothetical protein
MAFSNAKWPSRASVLPALLAALAAVPGACRCGSTPGARLADATPDARPLQDAGPDADRPDAWTDAASCDATFIELPPAGDSFISIVSHHDRWVAYDYRGGSPSRFPDVFLYDLKTCTEHRITADGTLYQAQPFVWNGRVTFTNELNHDGHSALSAYDVDTQAITQLTHGTRISNLGYAGGDYAVYADPPASDPEAGSDFYLLHIPTSQATLFAPADEGAASGGTMSPSHYTWPNNTAGLPTLGIHYLELATGEITKIPGTELGAYPTTWGDWVIWEDWRSGGPDLWGQRMGAGEEVHVTDNGAYNGLPRLRENLLCFRTTLWAGGLGWDLALLDLDTWVVRRVTETTHPGYRCLAPDNGWLVYRKQVRQDYYRWDKIYAMDLEAHGLVDSQGHVIPP